MKKKKNKTRNLLVLLAVLAVACGGYYGLLRYNAAQEAAEAESEEEELPSLLGLSGTISRISYETDGETISLVYQEEQWVREDDTSFPVNQTLAEELADTLSGAEQLQEIPDASSNLADYGLEEPAVQVTVEDDTGASLVLLVGDENAAAEGCYAMIQDSGQVYLTSSSLATAFDQGWMELATVDDGPEIGSEDIKQITVSQGDTTQTLRYEEAGWPEYDYTESANLFYQKADGSYMPVDATAQSDILNTVSSFTYEAVEAYEPTEEELAAAGLTDPAAVITIDYTTEETVTIKAEEEGEEDTTETVETDAQFVLYVGNYNQEEETYSVTYEGVSTILTMTADSQGDLLSLSERTLANLSPSDIADTSVDSIEVTYGGTTQTLSIERVEVPVETEETEAETEETASEETETSDTGETEAEETEVETETQVTYYLDGTEIEADAFRTYSDALEITGQRVLEEGEALSVEDAVLTVVFHRNVEAYPTVTISYIPYNENYYQVSVNGEEPSIVVNIRDVENVLDIFQNGLEAEESETSAETAE